MRRAIPCLAALLTLAALVLADEPRPGEKKDEGKKEEKKEEKKTEKKGKSKGKEAADSRSELPIALAGLKEATEAKVVEKLKALAGVDEALTDVGKKEAVLKLRSEGKVAVSEISKALQGTGAQVDLQRLELRLPTTVELAGPMRGWKASRNQLTRYLPAVKLYEELKKIDGVRTLKWNGDSSFKLGLDRPVPYARIAAEIARQGNKDGSDTVKDLRWTGDKLSAGEKAQAKKGDKAGEPKKKEDKKKEEPKKDAEPKKDEHPK